MISRMHCAVKNKLFSPFRGVSAILKTFNRSVNYFFNQTSKYILKNKINSKVPETKSTFVQGLCIV